jgi:hypothetical protein
MVSMLLKLHRSWTLSTRDVVSVLPISLVPKAVEDATAETLAVEA